jgi:DNA-binding NtrC family response regulator
MKTSMNIAVVEDKPDVRLSLKFLLKQHDYQVTEFDSPVSFLDWIKTNHCDLVMLDMNFSLDTTSGEEGLYCLKKVLQLKPELPVVAMTAWANTELIVKALKLGATDFIEKPWKNLRLLQTVKQALVVKRLVHDNKKLSQQLNDKKVLPKLVCHSPSMHKVKQQLDRVAKTQANILLLGENGTGKSILANYVHMQSRFKLKSLVSVNMGAIPGNLFESEMFGHKKGAFTGAHQDRVGKFELAQNNSLFLDEVGTLPLEQQVKLLRVLESGEFEAVGSNVTQRTQLRLISASNMQVNRAISDGLFRQDLYYRLNTVEIEVPSLRQRREDIPELAANCLEKLSVDYQRPNIYLSQSAIHALVNYSFPGNLRELNHLLERAVLFAETDEISPEDLALPMSETALEEQYAPIMSLDETEKKLLIKALTQCQGDTSKAAKLLKVSRSALYRRLDKFDISMKDYQ